MNVGAMQHTISVPDDLQPHPIEENREELDELFSRYRVRLYNTALKLSGNPDDAEDILQDGLLAAFRTFKTFQGRSQLSTWLTRIVINVALMRRRRNRVCLMVSIDHSVKHNHQVAAADFRDPGPNPEEIYARQEQFQCLQRVLQTMPKAYREALRLRHLEGMSVREAAEVMGLPTGTLKSRLHRARQWLSRNCRGWLAEAGILANSLSATAS